MDSLLERIEENKLDALYLFINESLRDATVFEVFFQNLMSVLPHNWSIQRVELGHEFLSMVRDQDDLMELICGMESLRTLIISDGYVPRKDNGSVHTEALLSSLPKARNLINLDLQRLQLENQSQIDLLSDALESLSESLEEIRITGLVVVDEQAKRRRRRPQHLELEGAVAAEDPNDAAAADDHSLDETNEDGLSTSIASDASTRGILDGPLEQCMEMGNLRSIAISQKQQRAQSPAEAVKSLVSKRCLLDLCQTSTTLQDLALRSMNLDDDSCRTLAQALTTNSFLTSLDLRQNDRISSAGYTAILQALERNYDLWCAVMVDNDSFQAKFNSLIELNQANRGDLLRNPTRSKLCDFMAQLNQGQDATSLWYFLSIHDSILFPLVEFLQFKERRRERMDKEESRKRCSVLRSDKSDAVELTVNSKRHKTTAMA